MLPPSTLLIGPAGTGKTTALLSLVEKGLKLRILATEPSAFGRLIMEAKKRNLDLTGKLAHAYISPAVPKWESLIDSARLVNTLSLDDIAKMRQGIAKPDGGQWIKLLQTIQTFGSLGDATEWGDDTAFCIDGLTGISAMSRMLTVGLKPNPAPGEWGVMQGNILSLISKLCSDCKCFFILISHVERELNEITGTANITVSTLGAKLAPKLPPLFTNVVYAKKTGDKFFWSTADTGVDTKNGDLPLSTTLDPSFAPIIDSYRSRTLSPVAAAPQTSAPNPAAT